MELAPWHLYTSGSYNPGYTVVSFTCRVRDDYNPFMKQSGNRDALASKLHISVYVRIWSKIIYK